MGRLTETLNLLLAGLGVSLPPWAAPLAAVLVALALLPALHLNFRTRQARRRMLRAAHARADERARLHAEALALVAGNPVGLVVVAEEALRRGHLATAREAVARLGDSGRRRDDHRRLAAQLAEPRARNPEAEALAIERLRERGQAEAAEARLAEALARWPQAEALRALRAPAIGLDGGDHQETNAT